MCASADFNNRLIELVRAHPSLYERDLRNAPYDSNKKKKTELWCSIATSLETDVSFCITRWNYLRERLRHELRKVHSDWGLLPKLRFIEQHKHSSSFHLKERQLQQVEPLAALVTATWRSLSPNQLIEHEEDEALQEAMDELQATTASPAPATAIADSGEDLMKRIEALLQGLGPNRDKAEKKMLAYLCKCNLRALNDESIDDIFI